MPGENASYKVKKERKRGSISGPDPLVACTGYGPGEEAAGSGQCHRGAEVLWCGAGRSGPREGLKCRSSG